MPSKIDTKIAEMATKKKELEGYLIFFRGTFHDANRVREDFQKAKKAFNKRNQELKKLKVTGEARQSDAELIKQYALILASQKRFAELKGLREAKRGDYRKVATAMKGSVNYVKNQLAARKGKTFKNPAVEKRANDYISAVEKVLDRMWDYTVYV